VQTIGLLTDHAPDEIPASHRDLVECPPAAALTTVMPDGYPQTSVMWCDFDGQCVRVNTMRGFAKELNMRRDPRVTLLCFDPRQPRSSAACRHMSCLTWSELHECLSRGGLSVCPRTHVLHGQQLMCPLAAELESWWLPPRPPGRGGACRCGR
jgi:hypothetical protein